MDLSGKNIMKTVKQILILLGITLLLAAGVNLLHPNRIPWVGDWGAHVEARTVKEGVALAQLSDVLNSLRGGLHLLVDARPAEAHAHGHIQGALSVPFEALDSSRAVPPEVLNSALPLIVYGSGPERDDGLMLAMHLRGLGCTDVSLFVGGIELWQSELLALEEGAEQ